MNDVKSVLGRETDRLLVLLAFRADFQGLEPSIADYHRLLGRLFNHRVAYDTVRKRLRKLENCGVLRSRLKLAVVDNSLVDADGTVKLERRAKVYKRVYALNQKSKLLRRIIRFLEDASRRVCKKELSETFSDDELIPQFSEGLKLFIF